MPGAGQRAMEFWHFCGCLWARRLFGPLGGAVRQDVLVATDWWRAVGRKKRKGKREGRGGAKKKNGKVRGDGRAPNSINQETGRRHRRHGRNSEYHMLLKCPMRGVSNRDSVLVPTASRGSRRPPNTSISTESPADAQEEVSPALED